jgi:ATP synthase F1 delta subunit
MRCVEVNKLSRRTIADAVAKKLLAGEPQTKVMRELAALLIDEHRLGEKDNILRDVEYMLAENDHLVARLTSARALSDTQLHQIGGALGKHFKTKHVELQRDIDPELIGGIIISTPLGTLDASIVTRLANLTREEK